MKNFEYTTHHDFWNSSLIRTVWYNANTNEMLVVLRGYEMWAYKYDGPVPADYDEFTNAESAGRYYATSLKRRFGPSKWSAPAEDVRVTEVNERPSTQAATVNHGAVLTLARPQEDHSTATRRHTVTFENNGVTHNYNVQASDVDAAVSALSELSDMLNVPLVVKSVTAHFE